jgi:endonuclease I
MSENVIKENCLSGDNSNSTLYCNNTQYNKCNECLNNIKINYILFRKTFYPGVKINEHLDFNIWLAKMNIINNNNDFFLGNKFDYLVNNKSVEHEVPKSIFVDCIDNYFKQMKYDDYYNFVYTDLHNIVYGDKNINMYRGHIPYGQIDNDNNSIIFHKQGENIVKEPYIKKKENTEGIIFNSPNIWYPDERNKKLQFSSASLVELPDINKGLYARTFFYMLFLYGDMLCDNIKKIKDKYYFSNKFIATMLDWNMRFPPTEREIILNKRKYALFGIINPFIIFPDLINIICRTGEITHHTHIEIDLDNTEYDHELYLELINKKSRNEEITLENYYDRFILKKIPSEYGYYRNETLDKDASIISNITKILNLNNNDFNVHIEESKEILQCYIDINTLERNEKKIKSLEKESIILDMLKEIKLHYDDMKARYIEKQLNKEKLTEEKSVARNVLLQKQRQEKRKLYSYLKKGNQENKVKKTNNEDFDLSFFDEFLLKYLKYKNKYLKYKNKYLNLKN